VGNTIDPGWGILVTLDISGSNALYASRILFYIYNDFKYSFKSLLLAHTLQNEYYRSRDYLIYRIASEFLLMFNEIEISLYISLTTGLNSYCYRKLWFFYYSRLIDGISENEDKKNEYAKYYKNIDRILICGMGGSAIAGDLIKTLYEDESSGFPQSWELPTLDLMHDLINEAHQEGIPVIMHSPSFNGQKFALEAGVDIIAHSMWNWYDSSEQFLDLTFTQKHKDLLLNIASKKVGYQPTFRAIYGEVDLLNDQFIKDPALKNVYPMAYFDWMNTQDGQWGKQKILNREKLVKMINPELFNILNSKFDGAEEMFKGIQEMLKVRMDKVVKLLADSNANLLFATDNGAMNMSTHPPGYNGYLEMQHWLNAGVSLEKIFMAATYNNAKAFHMDNDYGTITQGKIANLLILNKDPLVDITAYDAINSVIVRGQDYYRNTLSANQSN